MPTDEMVKNRYGAMLNIMIPFSPWTAGKHNYEVEEALTEIRVAKAKRESMRNMTVREIGESLAYAGLVFTPVDNCSNKR